MTYRLTFVMIFMVTCLKLVQARVGEIRNGFDCKRFNYGTDYLGHVSTTESGRTCQKWDSQLPHPHNFTHDWFFPERSVGQAENYCRNPEGSERTRLWCFTADPDVPWEYCDIPDCSGFPECKQTTSGEEYSGHVEMTRTGRKCVTWGSEYPDPSSKFCRNPNSNPEGPWCFTNADHTEWDICDVPFCKPSASCLTESRGDRYVGTKSMTRNNIPCQRWDAVVPHTSQYTDPDDFPDATLKDVANFCRNPASSRSSPWCYTVSPDVEWDYCDIPVCKDCKVSKEGREYAGTVATTTSGRTCQRWDSQTPHSHIFHDPDQYPDASLQDAANFCRNPDKDPEGPWCYTTDPDVVRESCSVLLCQEDLRHPIVKVKHVLHIGIDGLHPCVFKSAAAPNIMERLASHGSYTPNKGRAIVPTLSLPAWTAILCGYPAQSSGIYNNEWRPQWLGNSWSITPITGSSVPMPCLTDILQGNDANVHTAMFYGWDRMAYMANSGSPGRVDKDFFCDSESEGGYDVCDLHLAKNASAYLPNLTKITDSSYTFVYFGDTDIKGHTHGWCSEGYLKGVTAADDMVGRMLDVVDATGMADDMLILVTTDHGGKDFDHGTYIDDDLNTPVFFRGPGIKQNYQFEYTVHQEDYAPTIANLMGYKPSPWWSGHARTEMIDDCSQEGHSMYVQGSCSRPPVV